MPLHKQQQVYQLKVTLPGIRPPIWRRFQVAGNTTLADLHQVLQEVMGWGSSHLYEFVIDGRRYSARDDEMDKHWDATGVTLRAVALQTGLRFTYVYDFGDNWRHEVLVEKIQPVDDATGPPICITGKRACPPEDCGSLPGYDELVKAMRDPTHRRYNELIDWLGAPFDPEAFDLEAVNEALRDLRGLYS